MKLALFGATGATGRCLVEQALAQGHEVTAFTRNPAALTLRHERLVVVQGDVLDAGQVQVAVAGKEAVLCALGTSSRAHTTVLSEGTKNIIAAMEKDGVRRLVCESSFGVGESRGQGGLVLRYVIIPFFLNHVYADKEIQEQFIQRSNLDWVIVRPTRLTNGPRTGAYRAGVNLKMPLAPWCTVSRADVADFMLKQLTDDTYLRQAPAINN